MKRGAVVLVNLDGMPVGLDAENGARVFQSVAVSNSLLRPHQSVLKELTQKDITDAIRLQGSNEARPKITHASFDTYIQKYRVAFETCALVGVPHYSTKVTGYT